MQATLTLLEPELKEKSAATEALMIKLDQDKDEANAVKEVVEEDERVATIKANETKIIKDDAQRDLDEALPALEAANKAWVQIFNIEHFQKLILRKILH